MLNILILLNINFKDITNLWLFSSFYTLPAVEKNC